MTDRAGKTNYITAEDLHEAWAALTDEHPEMRAREAAAALGVSEAEIVAAGCGVESTRLDPRWYDLLLELEGLGEVMALTRNEVFVHEKVGRYANARVLSDHRMGQVLDKDIDLRIFFSHWHFGFGVVREAGERMKRSLQFFDAQGTAVHKVHLREESDAGHFARIVDAYRHGEQGRAVQTAATGNGRPTVADDEVDAAALKAAWRELEDTHDFIFLLRDFEIDRRQSFRLVGGEFAREVAPSALRTVLEAAVAVELPIMVFVGNHGCIQIHTGAVHRLVEARGWYNVLDHRFNLHAREEAISSAWVVRKPTKDGDVHSVEFFDERGEVVCYLFGERKEGRAERAKWREVLDAI